MHRNMFNFTKKDQGDPAADERSYFPLLPLRDIVVFPNVVVPLFVGREKSIKALEFAMSQHKEVFLSAQKDAKVDDPAPRDIFTIGTLSSVLQLLKLPDGTVKALIEGKERALIAQFLENPDFFMVEVQRLSGKYEINLETRALVRTINTSFEEYAKVNNKISQEIVVNVISIEDPGRLADTIAGHLALSVRDKQVLLETEDLNRRLEQHRREAEGRDRDPAARAASQGAGQETDGEDPEGLLSQRADARHPEGDGQQGRLQGRAG